MSAPAKHKSHAIRIFRNGGPEVLEYVEVELPAPGLGEVRLRQEACGLNFSDIYFRSGLYAQALPAGIGIEGAGTVVEVGPGVSDLAAGDRVAYAMRPAGAYAQERIVPAAILVKLPAAISMETAAAVTLKGLTVEYLFHRAYPLQPGQTILFHAAAGGVGLLACQWARALGVRMIGTVSSDEKAAAALASGCTHVINYKREDIVARVRELTAGQGVPVVYDAVGAATFQASLDCLAPLGTLVSFGTTSGPVPPFDIGMLASKGSLTVTRPMLTHYAARRADLDSMAARLFHMLETGQVAVQIRQRHALRDAARAHADLEGGRTSGSSILIP